jgi:tRNA(fMet)-specific endonuclease VapC
MTALLLDTTFLIDIERDDQELDAWIDDDDDVAMAAVTVAELQVGVELVSSQHRERRGTFVQAIIDAVPVLPYGIETALVHAELLADTRRSGRPRGAHDLIIAATAKSAGRAVVSADPSGFEGLPGVELHRHR